MLIEFKKVKTITRERERGGVASVIDMTSECSVHHGSCPSSLCLEQLRRTRVHLSQPYEYSWSKRTAFSLYRLWVIISWTWSDLENKDIIIGQSVAQRRIRLVISNPTNSLTYNQWPDSDSPQDAPWDSFSPVHFVLRHSHDSPCVLPVTSLLLSVSHRPAGMKVTRWTKV